MESLLIHKKFQEVASLFADKEALVFQEKRSFYSLTFKEVLKFAFVVNSFLKEENFGFQDKAVLYMENNPFWFSVYLGIVSLGGIGVLFDFQIGKEEIKNILADCEAKIIFSSPLGYEKIKSIEGKLLGESKIVVIDKNFFKREPQRASFLDFEASKIASLVYTSGTTDNPKAVMLSHKNFVSNFRSIWKLGFYDHRDSFLCILPLHHTYPFTVNLLSSLFSGAEVVFPQSLKKEDIIFSLKERGVSILVGVPQIFSLLAGSIYRKIVFLKPLIHFLGFIRERTGINLAKLVFSLIHKRISPNLKYMVSGGAKLNVEVAKRLFYLGFNIVEGYGLTEASPVVSLNPPSKIKIGSVGKPLPGVEVKTDTPDGRACGEILVRGDNISLGYFRKPKLTAEAFQEGWLHTKDIGFIDKDGCLYITGRKDECIVLSSGKNIWPEELENFYKEIPSIEEIGIFNRGDSLYGVVRPKKAFFSGMGKLQIYEELKKDIQNISLKVSLHKRLSDFVITFEGLPRTRLGKLKRFLLPKIFEEKKELAYSSDEFSYRIVKLLKNFLNKEVSLGDDFSDLGIDSLAKIQLGSFLERSLKMKIPDEELSPIARVEDLVEYLREKETFLIKEAELQEWSEILRESPSFKFLRKIRLKPLFLDIFLTFLGKALFFSIFKILYRFKTEGISNLPQNGPFLVCPNHTSYLDGLLVFASFPYRGVLKLYFMGLTDYFEHPFLSWLVKPARIIPINVSRNLREALKVSALLIERGKAICIFPEGRRSLDGNLKEFKKGVGILAKEFNVRIVPVAIKGTFKAWPVFKKLPRVSPLKITYLEPVRPQEVEEKDRERAYQKIVNLLRERIALALQEIVL